MMDWLSAINMLTARAETAVLVTLASAQGSSPREPGAKMLVSRKAQFDTIGGGHLEMRACEVAREMLAMPAISLAATRRIERFPLGPSLGQCCGGVVQLAFERIDSNTRCHFDMLSAHWSRREDIWRVVALDMAYPSVLLGPDGTPVAGTMPSSRHVDRARECHVMQDMGGGRWLVDPCLARRPQLILFGAGHVGAAIVRALADLPCDVTWVDEREELFPAALPANVKIEATDCPEAVIREASAGASYLVMTHSHALDEQLAEAILQRMDIGWFGLIGSRTKRMQFEHRLSARGIAPDRLARMTCPIGLPGISGKAPAIIAASVCAQLLQVWEKQACSRRIRGGTSTLCSAQEFDSRTTTTFNAR